MLIESDVPPDVIVPGPGQITEANEARTNLNGIDVRHDMGAKANLHETQVTHGKTSAGLHHFDKVFLSLEALRSEVESSPGVDPEGHHRVMKEFISVLSVVNSIMETFSSKVKVDQN